ncbi:MAG: substrate-binding domain-containing protein [Burkholderiales bacterium]|nr:substrate-binding domain-containing protein [Burkholderiales bacterium]
MQPLRILSAGAAQSVTERLAARFTADTGREVSAAYGAVGAMKARVLAGEAVDVVTLSAQLLDELLASGHLAAGTRRDLGPVRTGVAVRAGAPAPEVAGESSLRASLLVATSLVCPDPAIATAGKVVVSALDQLGIASEMRGRMHLFPNGYAAMRHLASAGGPGDIGITQVTEILADNGVTYVGPLPETLQMTTVYAAAVAAGARNPDAASEFIARLTGPGARAMLRDAGFEPDR